MMEDPTLNKGCHLAETNVENKKVIKFPRV